MKQSLVRVLASVAVLATTVLGVVPVHAERIKDLTQVWWWV
jgi:hypothetical protein